MKIEGKNCLITGGTAGIGLELAKRLSTAGARVALCGRDAGRVDRAIAELPRAQGVVADVAQPAGRQRLVDAVEAVGRLDLLINNAGVQFRHEFARSTEARIERELMVNLVAPLLLSRALFPLLEQSRGALVSVTSGLAWAPAYDACVYSASKAGLHSFTRGLRASARAAGVRVVEVVPPMVETEMTAGRGGKKLSPGEVAEDIVAGLAAGRDEIFVGVTRFIPFLSRVAPGLLEQKMNEH